ncbi:hypothetical protein QVD17_16024 [Tagetes erecta]|uniref:Jacalin-type lectin domain-containing protein n=1 Tax=Tagetes erecta TaxID=13708 RepID=A0AAD8KUD1_TARER|nr:hypothetical protein QVD17_16024 [Tagetes erecta]
MKLMAPETDLVLSIDSVQGGSSQFEGCISHGPWGGSQGSEWVYMLQGSPKKIKINLRHAGVIDFINFQTYFTTGETLNSSFGGKGGNRTDTICIDYPNEYLKSISGTLGNFDGSCVVTSVCFNTNQNRYGPYGTKNGNGFSYDGEGGVIVGFFGRANKYVSAIGVYVMPESLVSDLNSTNGGNIMPQLSSSMSRIAMSRDAGPWGASGGKPWDDGIFSTVTRVYVHLGKLNVIYALQFEYTKRDGRSVLSQIHGGNDGSRILLAEHKPLFGQVGLDSKDVYMTGISGYYGPVEGYNGLEAIASISFHTNKGIHGPYGEERGHGYTYFSSTSLGKVSGFHGKVNGFLSAIGVHMEYISEDDMD